MKNSQYESQKVLKSKLFEVNEKLQTLRLMQNHCEFSNLVLNANTMDEDNQEANLSNGIWDEFQIANQFFESTSLNLWNDLAKDFILSLIRLLEVRKIELSEKLDRL